MLGNSCLLFGGGYMAGVHISCLVGVNISCSYLLFGGGYMSILDGFKPD